MIFPDWENGAETPQGTASLPLYTEFAVDWEQGMLALRDGEPYTVSGGEALRIWVRLALHQESRRFIYTAHSHDYGNELASLLGGVSDQGILESRLRQYIREALLISPYITGVDGFSFTKTGSRVEVRFTVRTVYEPISERLEVPIG